MHFNVTFHVCGVSCLLLQKTDLVQIIKFLIMQLCPASYYKLPHIHIFSWQPDLKPLQSIFFPYYENLSFMII